MVKTGADVGLADFLDSNRYSAVSNCRWISSSTLDDVVGESSGDGEFGNAPVDATVAALYFGRRAGVGYRGTPRSREGVVEWSGVGGSARVSAGVTTRR